MHDDISPVAVTFSLFDRVASGSLGHPSPGLIFTVFLCYDFDLVCYHECGVKAYSELSDDVYLISHRCRCCAFLRLVSLLDLFRELAAAGKSDCAEILLKLFCVHADPVVADRKCTVLLVESDYDLKITSAHADGFVSKSQIAHLVDGI